MLTKLKQVDTDPQKSKKINLIVLAAYAVLFLVITVFHEPFFDEAQAWLIAKSGSLYDLLFVITHTEGHPPLWSLILAVPAKLGVPYLVGIKSVSFIISILNIYLIVFKTKLPAWVRWSLPFSYFFFYQYGVISRTYCILILAMLLAALCFKDKDIHPWRFVGSLALLCLSCAYGMVIAGAVCLCWVIDIIGGYIREKNFGISDSRIWALLAMLVFAILLAFEIAPVSNTYATNYYGHDGMWKKALYILLAMPGDAFFSLTFGADNWDSLRFMDVIAGVIVTVLVWLEIILFTQKKYLKYYFLPTLLLAVMGIYYMFAQHTGIAVVLIVSYAVACFDEEYAKEQKTKIQEKVKDYASTVLGILKVVPVFIMLSLVITNIVSCVQDVRLPYDAGEDIAHLIKEHNMENAVMMVEIGMSTDDVACSEYNSQKTQTAISILPFFDKNIFFNHNFGSDDLLYSTHTVATPEENEAAFKKWGESHVPEALIGEVRADIAFESISLSDYKRVETFSGWYIWKGTLGYSDTPVYVRRDCLEKYGFE